MLKKYLVFGLSLTLVIFLSGCLEGLTPEALAYANPLVEQFMEQYPNAQIQITHFTALQSIRLVENISIDCGKNVTPKDFYRITIDDPDSGLNVIAWIDWENKRLECAVKYGMGEEKTISKPETPIQTCTSHAEAKCYGDHVYWFDSCGHKQEKKEYCQQGCELGFCKEKSHCEREGGYCISKTDVAGCKEDYVLKEEIDCLEGKVCCLPKCESHAELKCYEGHVFWYNSCGHRQEKKEYCYHGCFEGKCKAAPEAFCGTSTEGPCETDDNCTTGGCSSQVCQSVNEDPVSTTCIYKDCYNAAEYDMVCKCVEGECRWKKECESHHTYKCYEGHVYWYDSCGNKEEKKYACEHGCENRQCKGYCQSHHEFKCYEGHVYWYNSCGNKEDKKQACEYGCFEGACIEGCRDEEHECYFGEKPCCEGLVEVPFGGYDPNISTCIAATCGWVCRPCGNGVCDENEDGCTCPEDCGDVCIDSDEGKNYHDWGTVTKGSTSASDHCNQDGTLTEKYCENNEIKAETVNCSEGYECLEGECIENI